MNEPVVPGHPAFFFLLNLTNKDIYRFLISLSERAGNIYLSTVYKRSWRNLECFLSLLIYSFRSCRKHVSMFLLGGLLQASSSVWSIYSHASHYMLWIHPEFMWVFLSNALNSWLIYIELEATCFYNILKVIHFIICLRNSKENRIPPLPMTNCQHIKQGKAICCWSSVFPTGCWIHNNYQPSRDPVYCMFPWNAKPLRCYKEGRQHICVIEWPIN